MLNTFLFDLDGTLLYMDHYAFGTTYFNDIKEIYVSCGGKDGDAFMKSTFMKAVKAMKENDGKKTNAAVFNEIMFSECDCDTDAFLNVVDGYYLDGFKKVQDTTKPLDYMVKSITALKNAGFTVALATDPMFPISAVKERMLWANLNIDDFAHVPTYDFHSYCKPNPNFFYEILTKLNKSPDECMMVGNSTYNDMPSIDAGIPCYMLNDCLLNEKNVEINSKHYTDTKGFYEFVKDLKL